MKNKEHAGISLAKAKSIKKRKGGPAVTMVTAYDYPTARLLDEEQVEVILVGDSLGMVVMGYPDTTHVVLDDIIHHLRMVARAKPQAMIVADLPINTYRTPKEAVSSARKLFAAGANAVKLEGGLDMVSQVSAIVDDGIPVAGHIGLLPQRVLEEGGYRIKGRTEEEAALLEEDVKAVSAAGACLIVIEGVNSSTAARLTQVSPVPTIGIGSGRSTCDGDVVVITDLIGAFPWFVPGFIKPKADVAGITRRAVREWVDEIRENSPQIL